MITRDIVRFKTFYKKKNPSNIANKLLFLENKYENNKYNQNNNNVNSINKHLYFGNNKETNSNIFEKELKSIEKDLNMIKKNGSKNDIPFINYIQEKEKKLNSNKESKDRFIELISYILQKNIKNENENEILKYYFLSLDKFVSLILPLEINVNDMMSKLSTQIQFEKKLKNNIIWKEGDVNDKLYIILKGSARTLQLKYREGECIKFEYIKYLIILYLYQEKSLISKIISVNNEIINLNENNFFTLLTTFKYYTIFKENNNFKNKYKDFLSFTEGEKTISEYILKSFNCLPIDSLKILDFSFNNIKLLYDFYIHMINEIKNELLLPQKLKHDIIVNDNKNNESKILKKIMMLLDSYYKKEHNFKKINELCDKISSISEIESSAIYECSVQDYLDRLDFEKSVKKIKKYDLENYKINILNKTIEKIVIKIKYFYYREKPQLNSGDVIGELALKEINNKMTETIITKDECYFGTITKTIYDKCLKSVQDKLNIRNVLFLTKLPLFKGISMNYFIYRIYKHLKKKTLKKGDILFRKGEKRENIYFIIKGELEFSLYITLKETNNIIKALGGEINDVEIDDIFLKYPNLKIFFNEKKLNIKFFSLKDSEVSGLDDITVNNIYLFDCICCSLYKTELYELNYSLFENCLKKEKNIFDNHEKYINLKRNIIVKRLLEERNGLFLTEINRKKLDFEQKVKTNKVKDIIKNGYMPIVTPESLIKKSPPLKIKVKKILQKRKFNSNKKKRRYGIKMANEYLKLFTSTGSFLNPTLFNSYNKNIEKRDKIISLKNSNFKYNTQKMINTNSNISKDNEELVSIKKFNTFNKYNLKNNTKRDKNLNGTDSDEISSINEINNEKNNFEDTFSKNNLDKYFKKIYNKTFIPDIKNTRTKKHVIPFLGKTSLKKHVKTINPIILKETSKRYIDKRSIVTESNFYKNNQHIFNSLLNDSTHQKKQDNLRSNSLMINKNENLKKKNMKYTYIKSSLFPSPDKNKYDYSLRFIRANENKESKLFQNKNRNYGIIDCLFLDNWEEKTQFERKFYHN